MTNRSGNFVSLYPHGRPAMIRPLRNRPVPGDNATAGRTWFPASCRLQAQRGQRQAIRVEVRPRASKKHLRVLGIWLVLTCEIAKLYLPDDGGHGGASPTCPGSRVVHWCTQTPPSAPLLPALRGEEARHGEGGGRREANRQAFLAGGKTQPQSDVGLAGAGRDSVTMPGVRRSRF